MVDLARLRQEALAHPDEDDIRLVLADALDEEGQPWGAELIRVQIELARQGAGLPFVQITSVDHHPPLGDSAWMGSGLWPWNSRQIPLPEMAVLGRASPVDPGPSIQAQIVRVMHPNAFTCDLMLAIDLVAVEPDSFRSLRDRQAEALRQLYPDCEVRENAIRRQREGGGMVEVHFRRGFASALVCPAQFLLDQHGLPGHLAWVQDVFLTDWRIEEDHLVGLPWPVLHHTSRQNLWFQREFPLVWEGRGDPGDWAWQVCVLEENLVAEMSYLAPREDQEVNLWPPSSETLRRFAARHRSRVTVLSRDTEGNSPA